MQDRLPELIFHPRELLSLDGWDRVLCVAPHPDDEVFACGGLLAALADRGAAVQVLILTCGQQGADVPSSSGAEELASQRRSESVSAAAALGIPEPTFLGLTDRNLRYEESLVAAIASAISLHKPNALLLPSLSEPHPDHQAAALAGLAAARAAQGGLGEVLFYECGAPLRANVHFPIDAVAERKRRAVKCFVSQLSVEDYEPRAQAMATVRAFGLRPPCQQAESYFRVNLQAVRDRGALAALPQWPWVRERLQLANDPAQVPLVSVLVRSMNRSCLPEALASVALQTHAHVELIVVNASGAVHAPLDYLPPSLRWRVVDAASDPAEPCSRARAANVALAVASGSLALFLDDDDLLEPLHLERLVSVLLEHPRAAGAYAGVRVETLDGHPVREYDHPWSRARLEGVNFLPIHAVLFRMSRVRELQLCFDEALPVLEDWDFWLKLTEHADLVHCPGVSAIYRQGLGQSSLGNPDHAHHWRRWHALLLERRAAAATAESLAATLAWHAIELDRSQAESVRKSQAQDSEVARLQHLQAETGQRVNALDGLVAEARALAQQHMDARDELQRQIELFSRDSQLALATKESELQRVAKEYAQQLAQQDLQAQQERHAAQARLQVMELDFSHQMAAKEVELQRVASEMALQLAQRETEAQSYAAQAQAALAAKEAELQRVASDMALQLAQRETEAQSYAAQAQAALAAKEAELQRVASEMALQLAQRETEAQSFAAQAQAALAAKEVELQRVASEMALQLAQRETEAQNYAAQAQAALAAKEMELQRFAAQAQAALDAKEAELQRVASEMALQLANREAQAKESAQAQQALDASEQRLQQLTQLYAALQETGSLEKAALEAQLAQTQEQLQTVLASRSWRWTAPLRKSDAPRLGKGV